MKKLFLSAAILVGSMCAFATTNTATAQKIATETIQDEFVEIGMDALPEAVQNTVKNSFPGAKLEKAYTNEQKDQYKLDISISGNMYTIYTDAEGVVIKK